MLEKLSFTLPALRAAYAQGTSPQDVIAEVYRRIEEVNDPALFLQRNGNRRHVENPGTREKQ